MSNGASDQKQQTGRVIPPDHQMKRRRGEESTVGGKRDTKWGFSVLSGKWTLIKHIRKCNDEAKVK